MKLSDTVRQRQQRNLAADNGRLRYELRQATQELVVKRAEVDRLHGLIDCAMWEASERALYRDMLRKAAKWLRASMMDDVADEIDEVLGETK